MTPNHAEVLSAFFDGEPVDPEPLTAALEDPEALEFLVQSASLKKAVHDDVSRPTDGFTEALRARLERAEALQRARRRLLQASLAASLLLAAAAGGFGVRGLFDTRETERARLPAQAPQQAVEPPRAAVPTAPVSARATGPRGLHPKAAIPSPTLRMRFLTWQDKVL